MMLRTGMVSEAEPNLAKETDISAEYAIQRKTAEYNV